MLGAGAAARRGRRRAEARAERRAAEEPRRRRRPPTAYTRASEQPPETAGGTEVQKSGAGERESPVLGPPALARLRAGLFFGRQTGQNEMNREQKTAVVEELAEEIKDAEAIFAVDYRGISVPQAAELRVGPARRRRPLPHRQEPPHPPRRRRGRRPTRSRSYLEGPTALAFVKGDAALAAKTIFRLGSEWELLDYKGGLMDGRGARPGLASRRSPAARPRALNAQFAGIVASPLTGLVRGLGSMIQGLALPARPDRRAGPGHRRGPGRGEAAPRRRRPRSRGGAPDDRRARPSLPRRPPRSRPRRTRTPARTRRRRPARRRPRSGGRDEPAERASSPRTSLQKRLQKIPTRTRRKASRWPPKFPPRTGSRS